VYGIDNAIAVLTSTQHRLEDAGLTAHLVQRDIFDALPFADAFFDAIISVQVIHHARSAQIAALIDEMARILKAGGLLFVTVPHLQNLGTHFQQIEAGLPHHYFTPRNSANCSQSFLFWISICIATITIALWPRNNALRFF
jgi:SAM-dependent methyltransferase